MTQANDSPHPDPSVPSQTPGEGAAPPSIPPGDAAQPPQPPASSAAPDMAAPDMTGQSTAPVLSDSSTIPLNISADAGSTPSPAPAVAFEATGAGGTAPGAPGYPGAPGAAPAPPHDAPANQDMVQRIHVMVRQNARRWRRLLALEALGLGVALPLIYLWAAFLLDNLVHLPTWGLYCAAAIFWLGAVTLLVSLGRRWVRHRLSEDEVALAMERRTTGGVQNRFINAIQLAREVRTGDPEYGQAVVEENYNRLRQLQLRQAAEMRPAIIRISLAAAVILVGVVFWSFQRAYFTNAAERILTPMSGVRPLYRTELEVDPGNIEASGDVALTVKIKGSIPSTLTFLRSSGGTSSSETVSVPTGSDEVSYVMRGIARTTSYAVKGGDFMSDYYRIEVPAIANLSLVKFTYHFPSYTNLPDRTAESATGDLEALVGTKARLTFVLDQPVDDAVLLVQRGGRAPAAPAPDASGATQPDPAPVEPSVQRIALQRLGSQEYQADLLFDNVLAYQIETRQGKHAAHQTPPFALHVRADQPPTVELSGLERQSEAMPDAILPLRVAATDDYGLAKVGLFYRRAMGNGLSGAAPSDSPATTTDGTGASPTGAHDDDWKPVEVWDPKAGTDFRKQINLSVAAIGASEGEKYEVAARAVDTDPLKQGRWTTGTPYTLAIGGEGVLLQLEYMQVLKTESDLKAIKAAQEAGVTQAAQWMRKLDPSSGMSFDDPVNRNALATALHEQQAAQDHLRQTADQVAKDMVAQAGNLRVSVGMLAETEMLRAARILDAVNDRDTRQGRLSALGDARLTEERTAGSLNDIVEQYVAFRQEWELANMIPFIKMMAERQGALRDESAKIAQNSDSTSATVLQLAAGRRQKRLLELAALARTSFQGMGERTAASDAILAKAFTAAAQGLGAAAVTGPMQAAASAAETEHWAEASTQQGAAAQALAAIHAALRKAQTDAAQAALAALQEKAKSDLAAQQEIDRLANGSTDNPLDLPDKVKIEDILHMREVAAGSKGTDDPNAKTDMGNLGDDALGILQGKDTGKRQEFKNLSLASTPNTKPLSFPNFSGRKGNKVTPFIQDKFEDLAGKLLDESESLEKKYDTYNLNAGWNIDEHGDVGKQGGQLNSTAASAATGNQKPPPNDFGGISRSGRQGARAHGMVLASESANLRGRDKALEGSQRAPDQTGTMKLAHPEDEQKSLSAGVGGKKVDDKNSTFNVEDSGHFDPDTLKKLGKPKDRFSIVERDDGPVDAHMDQMLRDLDSSQEQVIDRIKAVRKELKNLYLPTDHLDELADQLQSNLEALKDRPTSELFRMQELTLEKLRSTVRVFDRAHSDFQPGDLRQQGIRGRILDEPARQTIPGYEDAVKHYYEMLSAQ